MDPCISEYFKNNGILPVGLHKMALDEIKTLLVEGFSNSDSRKKIFEGFCGFLTQLKQIGLESVDILVDGSFITDKENPNDVDFVLRVGEGSSPHKYTKLNMLNKNCGIYLCHAYCYPVYSPGHPNHAFTQDQESYWLDLFGHKKERSGKKIIKGRAKGIILLTQNDPSGII